MENPMFSVTVCTCTDPMTEATAQRSAWMITYAGLLHCPI